MNTHADSEHRAGLWAAFGAFVVWGVMPLFWRLLHQVPALQILMHRVVWGAVLVGAWLFWQQGAAWWRPVLADRRVAGLLLISGLLIAGNWGLYIWAVNTGHVVETSLGYFINPLFNVVIGVAFLRERLRPVQWIAVAIAAGGVAWLTFHYGSFPWIALALAGSFALYGLVRKVAAVASVPGLAIESGYLLLPALMALGWWEYQGTARFLDGGYGWLANVLLVTGGALTALPLIGFAYALRRVTLSTIGVMQYIAPTLQLLIGVLVFHEPFGRDRAIGFAIIWVALLLFAGEGLLRTRRKVPSAA